MNKIIICNKAIITARYKHKYFVTGFLGYATCITLFNLYHPQIW
jgi:hypothetical protein